MIKALITRLQSLVVIAASAAVQTAAAPDFGPALSRFKLALDPATEHTEIAGPLISYDLRESAWNWALHPLLFYQNDPETDLAEFDFLYPFLTYDRFGSEYRFQIFQVFNFSGGQTQTGPEKKRFTIFPFYFQQRSTDPNQNYTAFLPFYGHLKQRLFRDEIFFVMLPIFLESRKKDVVTDNYLFPFFHLRKGNALSGWQFWPVVGDEHKGITMETNMWGEAQTIPGHKKFFLLWPFFFHNELGLGSDNPQHQLVLLPLFSRQHSPLRDNNSYLLPFGFTHIIDREKKYEEWALPWPIIDFARGEGKTANRVWPLFSRARTPTLESDFYLWPLYKFNRVNAPPLDRQRTRILLFLYSDLIEKNTETGTAFQRTDLWPLFTARRDHAGNERLQLFAPIEPMLPNNKSIERNYSPVWSVWRSEHNPKTGARSQSLLWNLYHYQSEPGRKKVSCFFGMFQYNSGPEGKRWRLFYIPFGRTGKAAAERSNS